MALTMPFGDQDQAWLTVSLTTPPSTTPVFQTALPSGQTFQLVSSDTNTVDLSLDSTTAPAVPDPVTGIVPVVAGSFTITTPATPANPNNPIGVTLNILDASGNVVASFPDTITVTEQAVEAVGDIFGTPTPVVSSAVLKAGAVKSAVTTKVAAVTPAVKKA